jgi:peptide/nickel transport system permease protein/oligopeptide transport system permease protein
MNFFRRSPIATLAFALLLFVTLASVFGPLFLSASGNAVSNLQFSPPTRAHWFGTDQLGRDLQARVLEGGRVSLLVGFCGALISLFIGTAYGLVSGYAGGRVDNLMMRAVEILYSVPRLIIILVLINAFDTHFQNWLSTHDLSAVVPYSKIVILILSLGFIEWLSMARIVRGQVLSLKNLQFVTAARALGQTHFVILTRHLLPNLLGIILIYLTLTIPAVILDESFLSFLGLGIQAPQSSWGTLLSEGAQTINPIHSYWWLLLFPAVAMSLSLLALNFLGDALRDALDPRQQTAKTGH